MNDSRGYRNHNPLNIRYNQHNDWVGQLGTDGEYAIFDMLSHGVRAATLLLRTYQTKYNLYTITKMVKRWAPHVENPTDEYIVFVKNYLKEQGYSESIINFNNPDLVFTFVLAMAYFENGRKPDYDELESYRQGIRLAYIELDLEETLWKFTR